MALRSLTLFLSLFLLSISAATARNISPSVSANSTQRMRKRGPIMTNGRAYSYVCHPDRFADLGLEMTDYMFCDKRYSYYDRIDDLVGRMSLAEKVLQIGDGAKGVERIGLPRYNWWSEILHGVSTVGQGGAGQPWHASWFGDDVNGATQFPEVINSAASFNQSLWRAIGEIVSTEGRAMYNLGHTGLTFWSPVINLARDPRWGRILETPGEDPFVVGTYAVNFVKGLQDVKGLEVTKDPYTRPIKVGSCCKHFGAYDIEEWFGVNRFHFDARVREQDMVESFNLPFEMCINEGDSISVMCSYNKVNGIPACANRKLMKEQFRGEWNLHGYIVSDCYAIDEIYKSHKFLHVSHEDAVAQVINAGLDLECGWDYSNHALSAVKQGKVKEKDIDTALTNLYLVLMRLGFFDGSPEFESLGYDDICSKEHTDMAVEAARQGMVLLKNEKNTLPLNKNKHKKLALGGPHVHALKDMLGNYAGKPCELVSPLRAFNAEAEKVESFECISKGFPDMYCSSQQTRDQIKEAAKISDATILFMGINVTIEMEFLDRDNLTLPPNQIKMIKEVADASKTPIILVIMSAGGVDISFAKENPKVGAILWAGYPGEKGGRAIADVIYGRYNPGGRLPITWYVDSYTKQLPMTSMSFRPIPELDYPGRTYKFYDGPVVYPFGYGLSYTEFQYKLKSAPPSKLDVKLGKHQRCVSVSYKGSKNSSVPVCPSAKTSELECKDEIIFEVEVQNKGKVDGHDAVIVYSKPPAEIEGAPIKQVVAFDRVFVRAGESKVVKFSVNACRALNLVETTAYKVLASGKHTFVVGADGPSFPVEVKLSQ